jgi:hypothetical protein
MTVGIRLRVVNVIKSWVTKFYAGTEDDSILFDIKAWAEQPFVAAFLAARNQDLIRLIDDRLSTKLSIMSPSCDYVPKLTNDLPTDLQDLEVFDVCPEEMARQITFRQVILYGRIKWTDLVKYWSENNASDKVKIKEMMDDEPKVVPR